MGVQDPQPAGLFRMTCSVCVILIGRTFSFGYVLGTQLTGLGKKTWYDWAAGFEHSINWNPILLSWWFLYSLYYSLITYNHKSTFWMYHKPWMNMFFHLFPVIFFSKTCYPSPKNRNPMENWPKIKLLIPPAKSSPGPSMVLVVALISSDSDGMTWHDMTLLWGEPILSQILFRIFRDFGVSLSFLLGREETQGKHMQGGLGLMVWWVAFGRR